MMEAEQEMMCVLLESLRDQGLISENIHGKARANILGTLDWPEFFRYAEEETKDPPFDRRRFIQRFPKEGQNGST